jgi:hypothetical protein
LTPEEKLKHLFRKKQRLQETEDLIDQKRREWIKLGSEIRSLGQKAGEIRKYIIDNI